MTRIEVWKIEAGILKRFPLQPETGENLAGLNTISRMLPSGAYTTFRTFHGKNAVHLQEHFHRLQHTAEMSGFSLSVKDDQLRACLRQILTGRVQDYRIRITLVFEEKPGDIYLSLQELEPIPIWMVQKGVHVLTCDLQREQPLAKRTRFIARAEEVRQRLPEDVEEAIMLNPEGEMLEGLSSNFYAVKAGEIWTAGEGVLEGVTRSMILQCAGRCGFTAHLEPVKRREIGSLAEAFISSSSRGVMPVVRIDGAPVGEGTPGPVTLRLVECYAGLLQAELETI